MTRIIWSFFSSILLVTCGVSISSTTVADDQEKDGTLLESATLYDSETLTKITNLPIDTPVEIHKEITDLSDVHWLILTVNTDGEKRLGMVLASKVKRAKNMTANPENIALLELPANPDEVTELGCRLLRTVGAQNENVVISPYGIWANARFWLYAARGETKSRLTEVLAISEDVSSEKLTDPSVRSVNRILRRAEVNLTPGFSEILSASKVECVVSTFDELARRDLNSWVQKWSNDQILEFYPEPMWNTSSSVMFVNCLSLDAKWQSPFKSNLTKEKEFTASSGERIPTAMMLQKSTMKWFSDDKLAVDGVILPYERAALGCAIIVPRSQTGIDQLSEAINAQRIREYIENAKTEEVILSLPKLELESSFSAIEALGLSSVLAEASDYSGMTDAKIKLAEVFQSVKLSVDEAGTKAAAATGATFFPSAPSDSNPKILNADHPFMVIIVHQPTVTPLIIARVNRPAERKSNPKE